MTALHKLAEMFHAIGSFIHENLVPTTLISSGLTIGYTNFIHLPLMSIFTDPHILELVKDYLSILSLGSGFILLMIQRVIVPVYKKIKEMFKKDKSNESNS
jgi:Na+-driven multidrug efflux pump